MNGHQYIIHEDVKRCVCGDPKCKKFPLAMVRDSEYKKYKKVK